jgi:hypothetical protein
MSSTPNTHTAGQQDFLDNYLERMDEIRADYEARGLVSPKAPVEDDDSDDDI